MGAVQWKALLQGDRVDLQWLRTIFSEGDPRVSVDGDENYFLESLALEGSDDAWRLMKKAKPLLVMINGAARASDLSYGSAQLARRFEDESGNQVGAEVVRAQRRVFRLDAGEPPPHPARSWLRLAEGSRDVEDALRLLGTDEPDWIALYKVVEIIESDVGSIPTRGWVSQGRLSLFTRTAQHQDASGDSARHARATTDPPKNPITLAEGRRLVLGVVQAWLSWKTKNP